MATRNVGSHGSHGAGQKGEQGKLHRNPLFEKRRQHLEALLQRELAKDALSNKVVVPAGTIPKARTRPLLISSSGRRIATALHEDRAQEHSGGGRGVSAGSRRAVNATSAGAGETLRNDEASAAPDVAERHDPGGAELAPRRRSLRTNFLETGTLSIDELEGVQGIPSPRLQQSLVRQIKPLSEWAALANYDSVRYEEERQEAARRRISGMRMHRAELDSQKREREEKAAAIRREREEEAGRLQQEIAAFSESERNKEIERRKNALAERVEREAQLAVAKAKRDQEIARHREEEDQRLRQIQQELEAHKRKEMQSKVEQKARMGRAMEENAEHIQEKRREKEAQVLEDRRMLAAYEQLLIAQEKARKESLERVFQKQRNLMQNYADTTGKEAEEKIALMDAKTKMYAEERERKLKAEEEAREQTRREENVQRLKVLQLQKLEHQRKAEEEADQARRYQQMAVEVAKQAAEEEKLKRQRRKERSAEYRLMLEKQIRENVEKHAKDGVFMNMDEKGLNSHLLQEALPLYKSVLTPRRKP